jgi:cobaltochelatase CobN
MTERYRQRVVRADGRAINVVQRRGHLSYCYDACCCGCTDRGYAPVPVDTYKEEWLRRKMRNVVHLTKGGCLGPCALANVATLVFDGQSIWFHSINTPWHVRLIFDYVEAMIRADRFVPPPVELSEHVFNFYDWTVRPRPASEAHATRAEADGDATIALLAHADTDLLALDRARPTLPPDLRVAGLSLLHLRSDEQMGLWIAGDLAHTPVVVLRLHGELSGVPGFDQLSAHLRAHGRHLVIVSGTGEPRPDFARASTVPLDVLDAVTTYLLLGGDRNLAECMTFLSDRLLLTGHGSSPPLALPEHGVYLRDIENATMNDWRQQRDPARPTAALLFYRAHLVSGNLAFVDAIVDAMDARGVNVLAVYTSSLRARDGDLPAALRLIEGHADVIVSTLSFALGDGADLSGAPSAFARIGVPVIQAIASGMAREAWEVSRRGLTALDTAINVAIPEFDGRIVTVPVSFKERDGGAATGYAVHPDRLERVAGIAAAQARLRRRPRAEMRVAFVLTNSSAKASQIGNAVGLDAPASLLNLLRAMKGRGYRIAALPAHSDALMADLLARGTYDDTHPLDPAAAQRFSRTRYREWFGTLGPGAKTGMEAWWGVPASRGFTLRPVDARLDKKLASTVAGTITRLDEEPWSDAAEYLFAAMALDHVLVALQPPRGYGMNPDAIYHTPDLPPTHHYAAFYRWLATDVAEGGWGADAIVHVGKHGTLEWLPGKGIGLSSECYPDALLGDLPLVYPFIVNDPGEGSQAKRRGHAVIVDHLMPAMTNAETYGPLATLNDLVNEYYTLEKLDPLKLPIVQQQIWDVIQQAQLTADLDVRAMMSRDHGDHTHEWDDELTPEGVPATLAEMSGNEVAHLVEDIDGYLCELGTAQIRDGLHVLGEMPPLPDTLRALTRLPNVGAPGLQSSLARAFGWALDDLLAAPGRRLDTDRECAGTVCRTHADVLERIEVISRDLFVRLEDAGFQATSVEAVQRDVLGTVIDEVSLTLRFVCDPLSPALEQTSDEIEHVLDALEGRFIPPGPSGAPTRGMAHVLPTGRNFYAVDPRALPSQAAWKVGQQLARELLDRYLKEEGRYPEMIGLGAWGTSQMRTHGDDVAEVLALLGVEPIWDPRSRRIDDVALVPLDRLERPRIDVTLRISGFFRDAFPHLITLIDNAVALVVSQDEPLDRNYPRKHYLADIERDGAATDVSPEEADARARYRIFGAKPGTYGAGIQQLLETRHWETDSDFATVFVEWGGYAYGQDVDGVDARSVFVERLRAVEVAVHNQDNREHDIFDSDDYYQFHGGMIASIRSLTGRQPKTYVGDSSRPDMPRVRDLREEALRVYRTRVINPKWLESIMRHGYKGGLELTATVDYIFGFDATAHVAPDFVYEGLAEHYALSTTMQEFLARSNPWALHAIAERLLEAADRQLWEHPPDDMLASLRRVLLQADAAVEERGEHARHTR